jgi:hypothetical protein
MSDRPAEPQDPPLFVKQIFDRWVNPEVERRKQEGLLQLDFRLIQAQIVFNLEEPCKVRLNEEVKAVVLVDLDERAKTDVSAGRRAVDWTEVTGLRVHLTAEDPNAAHITLVARPPSGRTEATKAFGEVASLARGAIEKLLGLLGTN